MSKYICTNDEKNSLLLYEVNRPPLQLHIYVANETSATKCIHKQQDQACRAVLQGTAIHLTRLYDAPQYATIFAAEEQDKYRVADPAFCFVGNKL